MQISTGDSIRWIGHDELCQNIQYDGTVTKLTKNKITFEVTNVGTLTIPIKDGKFKIISKDQITSHIPFIPPIPQKEKKEKIVKEKGTQSIAELMRNAMRKAKQEELGKEYVIEFGKTTFNFSTAKTNAYLKCFWDKV